MATNQVLNHGDQFSVPADAVTAPETPASSDAVVIGQMPAVALTDPYTADDDTSRITVKTNGVYTFDVNAAAGAIAIGDIVYIGTDGALSNTDTGVQFGYALGAVANAATTPIDVKIGY